MKKKILDISNVIKQKNVAPMLILGEDNILIIPDGYRWCAECEALTPHTPNKNKEQDWHPDCQCEICGYAPISVSDECSHCGYDADSLLEEWGVHEVSIHKEGCAVPVAKKEWHKKIENIEDAEFRGGIGEWIQRPPYPDIKCDCPKAPIFQKPNIFNTWNKAVYSMDCSNAREWGCQWRCPICGTINEHETGNC